MEPLHFLYVILVGFGAAFVQRVSGFGLGIFAMMFLPHFLPSHTAAATISCLFSCYTTTFNSIRYRKNVAYKTAIPMLAAALISIPVAVYFAAKVSAKIFEILLGSVLVVLSIYFLFFNKKIKIKPTIPNGIIAGTLGGALNGLFSTGGPPAVLYLTNATPDNATYFSTIQFYFCLTNIYATANRAIGGLITVDLLIYAGVGILGCIAGDFLGRKIFDKLDAQKLKYIIYIGMIISGVLMLF
ncbi:MAG: sulfite exporter TauE/SafE family protein [Clostridia bacterium]|nr:sulfite exporter TauE/SafE family protein [Clostridia bacterium]